MQKVLPGFAAILVALALLPSAGAMALTVEGSASGTIVADASVAHATTPTAPVPSEESASDADASESPSGAEADAGASARVSPEAQPQLPLPALNLHLTAPVDGVAAGGLGVAGDHVGVGLEATARAPGVAAKGESDTIERESVSAESRAEQVAHVAAPAAVATVALMAAGHSFGLFRWLAAGAVALYSRLAKSDLLDNEHRDKVYQLIRDKPGMALTELMETAGLGWGTTVYHLDRLERAGFVTSERAGLHRCYFPVGMVSKDARKALGALKSDTSRQIADYLVANPGVSQGDLCQALGLSASAASKQVTKLENAGLLRREREWKTVHLFPDQALPTLLQGESPDTGAPATPAVAAAPA